MIYSGIRCRLMSAGEEINPFGNLAYYGRCGCGWQASSYAVDLEDAERHTLRHIEYTEQAW